MPCENASHALNLTGSPYHHSVVNSVLLGTVGVVGNLIALWILYRHKSTARSQHVSVFYVLVTGLAWTDLVGKVLLSPMVVVSYALSRSLCSVSGALCTLFAVLMCFFGLCSMGILLAMALECLLSIGHPYLYQQLVTRRRALLILLGIYLFCLLVCLLPVAGFGKYKQYSPGTWCFIDMSAKDPAHKAFSVLYATLIGVMILAIVVCNVVVKINLLKMYILSRRQKSWTVSFEGAEQRNQTAAPQSRHPEELDHLVILVLMTLIFIVCSVPITVRAYINANRSDSSDEKAEVLDLMALRFLSVNSCVDPWVFIILRTSLCRALVHKFSSKVCFTRNRRPSLKTLEVVAPHMTTIT
ncbi:prostaglandin D2 receptor [Amia ocellicauda]|uniref:prostaglandin D2 receptor n=1 Tax=Amia ocellicauda TaxID=2972642 RepID=UPI0034643877|nr:PD2R protein [Amia calva]